jgi:hypothetical protein
MESATSISHQANCFLFIDKAPQLPHPQRIPVFQIALTTAKISHQANSSLQCGSKQARTGDGEPGFADRQPGRLGSAHQSTGTP